MAQIKIEDLPGATELDDEQLESVAGGVGDLSSFSLNKNNFSTKPLALPGANTTLGGIGGIAFVRG
jgi:hypothetical protein